MHATVQFNRDLLDYWYSPCHCCQETIIGQGTPCTDKGGYILGTTTNSGRNWQHLKFYFLGEALRYLRKRLVNSKCLVHNENAIRYIYAKLVEILQNSFFNRNILNVQILGPGGFKIKLKCIVHSDSILRNSYAQFENRSSTVSEIWEL